MYDWIITNKELLKLCYGLVISFFCLIIVLRTNKLFKLSLHQGIRYFRNAFFFYGIAFFARFILGALAFYGYITTYTFLIKSLFEFFLIMAGFFLLYSLLWKKFESPSKPYNSSLLNPNILVFYIMTFIIVVLDYVWWTYNFMFISQILIFLFAGIVSYLNYRQNGSKHPFLKFYFVSMLLILFAWVLNSSLSYFNFSKEILTSVYLMNVIFFFLFLFGVIKITSK